MKKMREGKSISPIGGVVAHATPAFARIKIRGFRGISELTIGDIPSVSIFTGKNGSGKTTILEAAWLLSALNNAGLVEVLGRARGMLVGLGSQILFSSLFKDLDLNDSIILEASSGSTAGSLSRNLKIQRLERRRELLPRNYEILNGVELIGEAKQGEHKRVYEGAIAFARHRSVTRDEFVATQTPTPEEIGLVATSFVEHADFVHAAFLRPGWRAPHRINDILVDSKVNRRDKDMLRVLQSLNPEVVNIEPYAEGGVPAVYVDVGKDRLIPSQLLGGGFSNLLDVAVWIGVGPAKLILVDEIEDGLHYSILPEVAKAILDLSLAKGLQIMMTTHSRDAVSAFADAAAEKPANLAFFNLVRKSSGHSAIRYAVSDVQELLKIGSDIR